MSEATAVQDVNENQAQAPAPKAKRNRTAYGITKEEFTEVWQNSNSTQEVADKLTALSRQKGKINGDAVMGKGVVLARVASLRKAKVDLKPMPRAKRQPSA